jgi:hypothetical protein
MDEMKYVKLTEVNGRWKADLIESLLEAHGIDVELIQEAVGQSVYPVTVDGLGLVLVFVPKPKVGEARELLKTYQEDLKEK